MVVIAELLLLMADQRSISVIAFILLLLSDNCDGAIKDAFIFIKVHPVNCVFHLNVFLLDNCFFHYYVFPLVSIHHLDILLLQHDVFFNEWIPTTAAFAFFLHLTSDCDSINATILFHEQVDTSSGIRELPSSLHLRRAKAS
ncbi:hypothetical protein FB192DRAFT_1404936 [Mucor lusitanicus]|uniref:Uncharacterized protein n=1 Tax=Mucor circinelloides f. lusitanicus TaxID=29924 RepID=A0A8H4EW41_MUCCL|nr:hypothetical protein FB192DRAFT_1404936 [Mucor lusitanicus]